MDTKIKNISLIWVYGDIKKLVIKYKILNL